MRYYCMNSHLFSSFNWVFSDLHTIARSLEDYKLARFHGPNTITCRAFVFSRLRKNPSHPLGRIHNLIFFDVSDNG